MNGNRIKLIVHLLIAASCLVPACCGCNNTTATGVQYFNYQFAQVDEQDPYLDVTNWRGGDAHVHTIYGSNTLDSATTSVVEAVNAGINRQGLDWVVLTDHGPLLGVDGTDMQKYDEDMARKRWEQEAEEAQSIMIGMPLKCMLVGEELGSAYGGGHLLAYGISAYVPNGPYEKNQDEYLERVSKAGGFSYIAHPASLQIPWNDLEGYLDNIEDVPSLCGFELISGNHRNPEEEGLLSTWDRFLGEGRHIFVIGGSDAHVPEDIGSSVRTYVFLEGDSMNADIGEEILHALNKGKSFTTTGPKLYLSATAEEHQSVGPGSTILIHAGSDVIIRVKTGEGRFACDSVKLISSIAGMEEFSFNLKSIKPSNEALEIIFRMPESTTTRDKVSSHYIRFEGQGPAGNCYTNPIFLEYVR